jgi:hypothetical protein
MIATTWKNLIERRRKRAERERHAETLRRVAAKFAEVSPSMRCMVFRAMERRGLRLKVSGAVQVSDGVWVASGPEFEVFQ